MRCLVVVESAGWGGGWWSGRKLVVVEKAVVIFGFWRRRPELVLLLLFVALLLVAVFGGEPAWNVQAAQQVPVVVSWVDVLALRSHLSHLAVSDLRQLWAALGSSRQL